MGVLFDTITYASEVSLTLIVDDVARARRSGPIESVSGPMDLSSWLNALQRQTAPLVHSKSSRANLEAWLDAVEGAFPEAAALPAP